MPGFGVVLGGGGAKGGYEIGVWKALRELEIEIEAVAGTSVGALNGALMVQGDFERAYQVWTSISMEDVINIENEIAAVNEDIKSRAIFLVDSVRSMISSGGLDVAPLKKMLGEVVDEEKIRESSMDFGMVTFSLTDRKPVSVFKNDIPEGMLIDYLLASACFPAFKPQEIEDKRFIDGGVYDNIPISLMKQKGMKNVIAVDISGLGHTRKIDTRGMDVIYIKNSMNLGGTLDFNSERSKRNIEIGYYDTLKVFGKLGGRKYFIDVRNSSLSRLDRLDIKKVQYFLGLDTDNVLPVNRKLILDKINNTLRRYGGGRDILMAMAEITAEEAGMERCRVYTLNELVSQLLKEYENLKNTAGFNEYINDINKLITGRDDMDWSKDIRKLIAKSRFLIYLNPTIAENDKMAMRFRRFIALALPKVSIANMFMSMLISNDIQLVESS